MPHWQTAIHFFGPGCQPSAKPEGFRHRSNVQNQLLYFDRPSSWTKAASPVILFCRELSGQQAA